MGGGRPQPLGPRRMRLAITHATRYRYSERVFENYNEVRLQPVSDETQECHAYELATVPAATIRRYHDFHLNLVDHFYLAEPHETLEIVAHSTVTTQPSGDSGRTVAFPRSRLAECRKLERCYDFLQRSEYVSLEVDVWRLAQDYAADRADAWETVRAMTARIHGDFGYDPRATTVSTHMLEVLRQRRGVCQDFAHVLIGLCRSLAIPARYVSGYLFVDRDPSRRGDLASHAWVEVFLPEFGWLGVDPTHGRVVDEHYVKVAVGRDYADAAPIRGNFKGRAHQEMTVELRIERLDAAIGAEAG